MPEQPGGGRPRSDGAGERAKTPDELQREGEELQRRADELERFGDQAHVDAAQRAISEDERQYDQEHALGDALMRLGGSAPTDKPDFDERRYQAQSRAMQFREVATRLRAEAEQKFRDAAWARRAIATAVLTFGALMTIAGVAGAGNAPAGTASSAPTAAASAATGTPAASGASTAPNQPPVVGPIVAVFNAPQTSYTVQASDPEGQKLTYTWTKTNPCGTFTSTDNVAVWNHPDVPGGCPAEAVHPAIITVTVSDGIAQVTSTYAQGSAPGTGTAPPTPSPTPFPTTTTRPSTATPTSSPTPSPSPAPGGGGPNVPLTGAGLLLAGAGGAVLVAGGRTREAAKDPCEEEKRRVERARAALDAARRRRQRILDLKAASEKAQADVARAQSEYNAATDERTTSWYEDRPGHRVYTNKAQAARAEAATAALRAATDAAAAAKSAYEGAGNGAEITQAGYAVEDAERELQRAEEALARCLKNNAPPPTPPTPPTPPPTTSTPTPTTAGGPVISTPAPSSGASTPPQKKRPASQRFKYECSMHTDLDPNAYRGGMGHANANLRKTTTDLDADGNVIGTKVEEWVYDFAPKGNAGLLDMLILGTPGVVVRNLQRGGGMATNWYREITQEGYDTAKAWADNSVTSPPTYRGATMNCVDYARELCTQAGGDPPSAGYFVSTPEDLVTGIKGTPEGVTPKQPDPAPTGEE